VLPTGSPLERINRTFPLSIEHAGSEDLLRPFDYHNPVRIVFGAGAFKRLGDEAVAIGNQPLVVSYADEPELTKSLQRGVQQLADRGMQVTPFFQVQPNPDVQMVERGVQLARDVAADCVIGIGGGSVMDTAKAIAAGVDYQGGDLWNMVNSRHDQDQVVPPQTALPTLMVPTLAATGSEMNNCAVLSHRERGEKSYIWSDCLFPRTAILDPRLTYTLPKLQTACGGVDTISHVLEIYLNGQDQSDLLHAWQEGLMRTVIENLPAALADPRDRHAREELMWCASCAINGWASPGDPWTPMHQIGHVLTARHQVNHATSLALVMPAWMDFFKTIKPERYFRLARRVMQVDPHRRTHEQIIDEGIDAFRQFLEQSGLPTRLSQVGITHDDLSPILDDVQRISFNARRQLTCNPPVTEQQLMTILEKAL
jgi:alcohol dehydrogenase YqhD (iron-dependent ADH family)